MDLLAPLRVPAKLTPSSETSRLLATLRDRYHSTRRDLCTHSVNLRSLMARCPEPSSMDRLRASTTLRLAPHSSSLRAPRPSPGPAAGSRCQKATSERDAHRAARSGTRLVRQAGCTLSTDPSRPGQAGHDLKLQARCRESLRPRAPPSRWPLIDGPREAARAARPSPVGGGASVHPRGEAR